MINPTINDYTPASAQALCCNGDWIDHINEKGFLEACLPENNKGADETTNLAITKMLFGNSSSAAEKTIKLSGIEILLLIYGFELLQDIMCTKITQFNLSNLLDKNTTSGFAALWREESLLDQILLSNTIYNSIVENQSKNSSDSAIFKLAYMASDWMSKTEFSHKLCTSEKISQWHLFPFKDCLNDDFIDFTKQQKYWAIRKLNNELSTVLSKKYKDLSTSFDKYYQLALMHPPSSAPQDEKLELIIDLLLCYKDRQNLKSQSEKLVAITNANEKLELAQRISRRWGITEDIKLALLKKVFPGEINHSLLTDLSGNVYPATTFFSNIPVLARFFDIKPTANKTIFETFVSTIIGRMIYYSEMLFGFLSYYKVPYMKNFNILTYGGKPSQATSDGATSEELANDSETTKKPLSKQFISDMTRDTNTSSKHSTNEIKAARLARFG